MTPTTDTAAALRRTLEPLDWPERFEELARAEKIAATKDEKAAIGRLRRQMADEALRELSAGWNGIPLKEGVLRLASRRMRGALGRAAKDARDRCIADILAAGGAPLNRTAARQAPFAVGFDERVVELPLAVACVALHQAGEVLDAGAALNLPIVRSLIGRPASHVVHFTQSAASEPVLPGDDDRFTFAFGDLRDLPFPSGQFDRIACVSTLEHVGMDNDRYGGTSEHAPDTAVDAVAELLRVLAPGGRMLVTVPYGRATDQGWFRVLDQAGLERLLAPAAAETMETRFFYYDRGWIEDGPVPPPAVVDSGFVPDVICGIAVAVIQKQGGAR